MKPKSHVRTVQMNREVSYDFDIEGSPSTGRRAVTSQSKFRRKRRQ